MRWLAALPVWVALAFVGTKAAHIGWADFNSLEARYRVDQVARDGVPLNITAWLRTKDQLETSLDWDPDNPVYHEYLASLYFMRAASSREEPAATRAFYELALEQYLRTATLRPTSGYTHASVASVKFRLGQFDRDFSTALLLATKYGPWEPAVQEQVMEAGLPTWGALADGVRGAVRGNVRRALEMNPKRTREFLTAHKDVLPDCRQLQVAIPGICPTS
jgi:hypothetical protein